MSKDFFCIDIEWEQKALKDIQNLIAFSKIVDSTNFENAEYLDLKLLPKWLLRDILLKNPDENISKGWKIVKFFDLENLTHLHVDVEEEYNFLSINSFDDKGNSSGIARLLQLVMKQYDIPGYFNFEASCLDTPGGVTFIITKDNVLTKSTSDIVTEFVNSLKNEEESPAPN